MSLPKLQNTQLKTPMPAERHVALCEYVDKAIDHAVTIERERCAKIAETTYAKDAFHFEIGTAIAKTIRKG
jgi:hypothetical protein